MKNVKAPQRSITGVIPGTPDPAVADDVSIGAKIGEYIFPQDVASFLGEKYLNELVEKARKQMGSPQGTGPKAPGEEDNLGRMNKPGVQGIADVPGMANGGLLKTWNDSNSASNKELERNFPGTATTPPPPKEQMIADAGLTIEPAARGTSTIAGNGTTPFIPKFQGTAPAAPIAQANNVWTDTLKQAGQPLAPPAASKAPPLPVAAPVADINTNTGKRTGIADTTPPITPGTITRSGRTLGIADAGTLTASGKAPMGAERGVNADGTAFDNNAAMQGIRDRQAINDAYDMRVADTNRFNAAEKSRVQNRSIADRFNDLESGNTTWDLKRPEQMALATASFNADRKGIADTLASNTTRQGQELALEGQKYTSDNALKGNIAQNERQIAVADATARGKHQADLATQTAKDGKEVVKSYYDAIKDRTLPAGFEGQHMTIAKDLANAADPSTDFGIYYSPGSSRQGIATQRSIYEPLLSKYTSQGYKLADAHSHAYRDLLELEKSQNVKLHKPFPLLDNLTNRVTKPTESLFGA